MSMKKFLQGLKARMDQSPRLKELVAYLFFGVMTTLINWLSYIILTLVLGLNQLPPNSASYYTIANLSNITSFILSVLFAFFTNKKFVFRSKSNLKGTWREFGLFVSARVLSYLIFDLALFNLLLGQMDHRLNKLLMNVGVVLFNYVASRLVIFKKR